MIKCEPGSDWDLILATKQISRSIPQCPSLPRTVLWWRLLDSPCSSSFPLCMRNPGTSLCFSSSLSWSSLLVLQVPANSGWSGLLRQDWVFLSSCYWYCWAVRLFLFLVYSSFMTDLNPHCLARVYSSWWLPQFVDLVKKSLPSISQLPSHLAAVSWDTSPLCLLKSQSTFKTPCNCLLLHWDAQLMFTLLSLALLTFPYCSVQMSWQSRSDAVILRKACLQGWPLASKQVSTVTEPCPNGKSGLLCLDCLCWICAFLAEDWSFGPVHMHRHVPMWPAPINNLRLCASDGFLWAESSQMCHYNFIAEGKVCVVCSVLGRKEQEEACTWVPPEAHWALLPYDPAACLYCVCMLTCFSCVWLFVTLWTVAHQVPLSMGFSREEYWSGLLWPPLGDLPDLGFEHADLVSPALAGVFFTSSTTIIVINISHEYSYMLCPVTPSSEHPNIVLWAPDTYWFGISALLYHYVTAFYWHNEFFVCRPCIPSHRILKDRNMPYMYFYLIQIIAQNTQQKPKKYLLR